MKDPFLEKRIMRSIIQSGLLPGGASERTGNKYSSPDVRQKKDLEEVQYDLDKPRVGVYTNTWKSHHHTVYWCNLRLAQRKGLQFYQTRSHAITLSSALLAICIEKVVCMKTGTELYCKVCQSPRLPRVTLTPNPQHSLKDPPNLDARQSDNYESELREHRRTCKRQASISESQAHHTPQLDRWTQIGKKRSNDWSNNLKITQTGMCCWKPFKRRRRSTISVKNQRIWLLICWIPISSSSSRQCSDGPLYWEIGFVYCTCGKSMQTTEQNRQSKKNRYDVLSIPGYVIKKDESRGARHGQSKRQVMYHKARDMLRKAKTKKNGQCKTIL